MTTIHRAAATLTLLGILVGASACAPPAQIPTPSPTPPAAEPTEEPTAPTEPQSELPLTCEEVIPSETVMAAFVTPVQLRSDETSTPPSLRAARVVQGGALSCLWGSEPTGTGHDERLQFTIVAATSADYDNSVSASPDAVVDTLGDRSVLDCTVQNPGTYLCETDVLVGDYWIDATVKDSADGVTVDSALTAATGLLVQVVTSVSGAGALRPLWTPPADAFTSASLCSNPAHASALLGVEATALSVSPDPVPQLGASGLAVSRSAAVACEWSEGERSTLVETLQGGAWWTERMAAAPLQDAPDYQAPVPIEVSGVDAAYLGRVENTSIVILQLGGSVISVTTRELDPASVAAAASAFVATLGD